MIEFTIGLGDILTIISIIVVVMIGMRQMIQTRNLKKQENTLDILLTRFTDPSSKQFRVLYSMMESNSIPDGQDPNIEVDEALNLHEFLSAALRKNILDIDLVYDTRAGSMIRIWEHFKPYVERRRQVLKNEKIYEHFEWIVQNEMLPRRKCPSGK